ncbi:FkbM family methyltransferase [Verrucomicrobiota bacterium]
MSNGFLNSSFVRRLADTRLGRWARDGFIHRSLLKSSGDWRYPFMAFGWAVASFLTRRRTVSVDGVKVSLPCKNWITHFRWYLYKTKEIEVRRYIDEYVKDKDVFFDIGANIGVFTLYTGKKHPGATVYAFEPEYSNLALLKENIIANDLTDTVKPFSVGIADTNGFSLLHLQDLDEGAAAHTENPQHIPETAEGFKVRWCEGITVATLDHICEQLDVVPNTMKIDTDGNEPKVLAGATKLLANNAFRSMIIEMPIPDDDRKACEDILAANGFHKAWHDPDKTRNEVWARE